MGKQHQQWQQGTYVVLYEKRIAIRSNSSRCGAAAGYFVVFHYQKNLGPAPYRLRQQRQQGTLRKVPCCARFTYSNRRPSVTPFQLSVRKGEAGRPSVL
jgi:hypothetical protein